MLLKNVKKVFLTGGAGFIGSHILDILLKEDYCVTVYDNFSNGRKEFIETHLHNRNFSLIEADIGDPGRVTECMGGHDLVWHLAANTDIIGSALYPERDLRDCVIGTFNVLNGMRKAGIKQVIFSSTGAVYGDLCRERATGEDAGPLLPVSTYAAGKIGSEAFISAFCSLYGLKAWIYRFGNVIGARMTHGVIYDFIKRLKENPSELMIYGDGTQEKNYFLVEECIYGMAFGFNTIPISDDKPCDVFNLGTDSVSRVLDIAEIVKQEMGLSTATIKIQGTKIAWPGDQPKVHITVGKMLSYGWRAKLSSDEAVRIAVRRMLGKEREFIKL
jgi:UDP-glucose 4-epimerase